MAMRLSTNKRFLWWLLLASLVLSMNKLVDSKKLSKGDALLARSYGYSEKAIEKWKSGSVTPPMGCSEKKKGDDFFSRYRPLQDVYDFVQERFCTLRQEIDSVGSSCKVITIGESVEGRPILAIEIRNPEHLKIVKADFDKKQEKIIEAWEKESDDGAGADKEKRKKKKRKWREIVTLMVGTVHAREWISTTSVLLSALRVDVTDVSLFVVPIVNPDGYVYTWSGQKQMKQKWTKGGIEDVAVEARYFRKNRRINHDGTVGVDLNRNYGSSSKIWGRDKKSKSINLTGSDIYQGISGFSEPETAAVNQYYQQYKRNIAAFYDVHCCIPAILEPYTGNKNGLPQYLLDTGKKMLTAINKKAPTDTPYEWQQRPPGSASGTGLSSAWAFAEQRIPFVYVLEVRGKFVMPCSEIKPIGMETLLGLEVLLKEVSDYLVLGDGTLKNPDPSRAGGKLQEESMGNIVGAPLDNGEDALVEDKTGIIPFLMIATVGISYYFMKQDAKANKEAKGI